MNPSRRVLRFALGALLALAACDDSSHPEPVAAVEAVLGSLSVEPVAATLVVGSTVPITQQTPDPAANARARILVVSRDPAGTPLFGRRLRFTSSAPGVAEVSDSGVVRAVAPGTARITIASGTFTAELRVTVERPYTLTYLGTLPGAEQSRATSINELGQVVGYTAGASGNVQRAFFWESGRMTALTFPDTLGMVYSADAVAVNEAGQVAGTLYTSTGYYVYLWRSGASTLARISALISPYQGSGVARALNDRGEIVGSWRADFCTRNCPGGGFVVRGGQAVGLSNYGKLRIEPAGINNAGQIAGTLYTGGAGTESGQAFFLESERAPLTLLPTSQVASGAGGIDEQGRVVGTDLVLSGTVRPFFWSPGGAPTYLGVLRSGSASRATRANAQGVAIGSSDCFGCTALVPVLFRGAEVVRVNDLFVAGDWSFDAVTDINDRGQVVGYGKNRTTGATGALLLTPAP
ncbi:MAG: hypothetical protein JO040_10125 [Gemmatimonadetes bacterium]|nr:hypothetical protein [Gemmatimonadota bacterium]